MGPAGYLCGGQWPAAEPETHMSRVAAGEVTWGRLRDAVMRRVRWLPSQAVWRLGLQGARWNQDRLRALAGIHSGERCFILANGPSLAHVELDRLAGENVFGMNRVYLLFQRTEMRPRYYVCINDLVLQQFAGEIRGMASTKFLSWTERRHFPGRDPSTLFVSPSLAIQDSFVDNPTRALSSGGTVTFVALQLAFYMGFRQVILLGLDHAYASRGVPNTSETRTEKADKDHFDPAYFPPGTRWQLPDLKRSEAAYAMARTAFEAHGGRILDATIGGRCPVFERCELESVL